MTDSLYQTYEDLQFSLDSMDHYISAWESYRIEESLFLISPAMEGIVDTVKLGWEKLKKGLHELRVRFSKFIRSIIRAFKNLFTGSDEEEPKSGTIRVDSDKVPSSNKGKIVKDEESEKKAEEDKKKVQEFVKKAKDAADLAEQLEAELKKDMGENADNSSAFQEAQKKVKEVSSTMRSTMEEGKKIVDSQKRESTSDTSKNKDESSSSDDSSKIKTSAKNEKYLEEIAKTVTNLKKRELDGKLQKGEMERRIPYILRVITLLVEDEDYTAATKSLNYANEKLSGRVSRSYDKRLYNTVYSATYKRYAGRPEIYVYHKGKVPNNMILAEVKYLASREVFLKTGAYAAFADMIKYHKVCKYDSRKH